MNMKKIVVFLSGFMITGVLVGALYYVQIQANAIHSLESKKEKTSSELTKNSVSSWFEKAANGFETQNLYPATEMEMNLD